MGSACAVEVSDVSNTEDSNLTNDNAIALSQEKLEVSSGNSISETNMVNSHDDNLNDYPEDSILKASDESYYEDNNEQKLGLAKDGINETVSVSNDDSILNKYLEDSAVSDTDKIKTNITAKNMHYASPTTFKVVLQDVNGNNLKKQTVSLEVKGKKYTGKTNSKGIAYIETATLPVGTYDVTLSYAGNSNYSPVSVLKKVKISSSLNGKDLKKSYGESKYYSVTFWKERSALNGTSVTFYIGDKKYVAKTDANGVAILKEDLKPGKYVVTTTNPYSNEKLTNNIVVKKDSTSIEGKSKVYIPVGNTYYYKVAVTSNHSAPVKNCKVSFTIANTTLTANTDNNGKANIAIPNLKKGTYDITYKLEKNEYFYSSNSTAKVCIISPSTKFTASNLKLKYKESSKFKVTFTDKSGKPLSNKKIKFVFNNEKYYRTTDSKGVASLTVGNNLKPGTYKIKYSYSSDTQSDYNYGTNKIFVSKLSIQLTAKNLVMKYNDGSKYKAFVKDNSGKPLKGIKVVFNVNGKNYEQKTNLNGVAKFKVTLPVGYYTVKSSISDAIYTADPVSKHILVNGTKFKASNKHVGVGSTAYYSLKLFDGMDNPVKNALIKFTFEGKNYSQKTDKNGFAKVNLGVLSNGTHKIKYSYDENTKGSSKIFVVDKVTLKQVIAASQTVKDYIEDKEKLPSSVKVGSITVSTAQYLYLASKAIVELNSNKNSDIVLKKVTNPSKPGSAENLGNLNDYVSVAKSVISTVDSTAKMPNSVSSSVGNIGYKGLVYAFARVVAFYDDEGAMPSYVAIKELSSSSTSSLNSKNTISNLASYLAASTNCQVNNDKIKQLVTKLTSGLTSDKAKATAIYNYVRDAISYSFYYDTKYGAVGTLNAGTGNCVDHSHLLVAMYRTAGLPARYVHGTCTFSSGTYGHVWTQVLIGNTWIVSDATSARNSFGNVVNWNPSSYSLHGYFSSIGF
jgi:hypothetical protein